MKIKATDFVMDQIPSSMKSRMPDIVKLAEKNWEKGTEGLYSFSRIVRVPNLENWKCPIVKITPKNVQYLETGYISRTEGEIPYLKRWFPKGSPVKREVGTHLDVIVYSAEQLAKEGDPIDANWGIVCVNVEIEGGTLPPPITMINNHLGIDFGGNGVKINRDDYLKSVEFWDKHAQVGRRKA